MRSAFRLSLASLPLLAACAAGSGGGSDSTPAALAFSLPDQPVLTYTQADTGEVMLDMGGQVLSMDIRTDAVMDLEFAEADDGLQVTASWRELDASMSSQMMAPQRGDETDVDGPLVFTLGPRGEAEVVRTPEIAEGLGQLVSPTQTALGFFPRLPGTPPTPGMTWTDTIRYDVDEGGVKQTVRTLVNYTVVGDTLVAGRTLLKVDMDGSQSIQAEARQQGMRTYQDMSGAVGGFFLWDLATGTMEYQFGEVDMSGTMDLEAAPYPLDMRVSAVSHVTRSGN